LLFGGLNATEEGIEQKDSLGEYPHRDCRREATEASGCDRSQQSWQVQEEEMSDPLTEFLALPDKEQYLLLMNAFKRLYEDALTKELEQLNTDTLTKQ
jgi:hypothetical protein